MTDKLKVLEFFSGIGAFRQGLINQNIEHEVSGISEYDKYAIKSYNAMFGETENFGDITKIKSVPKSDFWTYGFPCQDISVAGDQEGIKEGTRSGLLLEFERILESVVVSNEQPKMLLMENVKNLVSKKHKPDFDRWLKKLDDLGYNSYWEVLNTKNYGLPQNRERVFCFSIRKELDKKGFDFPIGFSDGSIITYTLQKQVRKRKNTCDIEELKALLKKHKKESELTINQIKDVVSERKTLVEHWFRSDNCFSIPEEKNWFVLKDVLEIETDKFDNFVTEFEILDGVYEKSNRIYDIDGICPTLTTAEVPVIVGFEFPKKQELKLRLKDILEDKVDEKFYINNEKTKKLLEGLDSKSLNSIGNKIIKIGKINSSQDGIVHSTNGISQCLSAGHGNSPKIIKLANESGNHCGGGLYDKKGISPTLTSSSGGGTNNIPKIIIDDTQGFEKEPLQVVCEQRADEGLRFFKDNICGTIRTINSGGDKRIIESENNKYRIRKLLPIECWRLQGFSDEQFAKAELVNSKTQLYKQAGNSISVPVLEEIYKQMVKFEYLKRKA